MFYCDRVVVQAPGKLNLSLNITGTNQDGYHTLETVMQAVDLSDLLIISKIPGKKLRITSSNPLVPEGDTNIVHKAANYFFAATGLSSQGLSIHIDKRLPMEAGLAGGSADAAAVLVGLNRLYETGLSVEQLCQIGVHCGADVPFCIQGGCCLAKGIGEILTPLGMIPGCTIAIAKPSKGMSSQQAYQLYDKYQHPIERPNTQAMLDAIAAGDLDGVGKNLHNVFEQVGNQDVVELLKGIMLCDGAVGALMSGSGTAVFGLFHHQKDAKVCVKHLQEQVGEAFLAQPTADGPMILHCS